VQGFADDVKKRASRLLFLRLAIILVHRSKILTTSLSSLLLPLSLLNSRPTPSSASPPHTNPQATNHQPTMAVRAQFENSNECVPAPLYPTLPCATTDPALPRVGVFSTLTNSYALVAVGASENFYRYASTSLSAPAGWAHVKGRVLTHMLAQYLRGRAAGRHPHLPCDDRRHQDYRAVDRRVRFSRAGPGSCALLIECGRIGTGRVC
jgi:hypothetical protein